MTRKIYTADDPLEVHLELDTTLERRSLMEFICANAKSFGAERDPHNPDKYIVRFYDSDGKPLVHHKLKPLMSQAKLYPPTRTYSKH